MYKDYLLKEKLVERVIILDFVTGETRSYGGNEHGQLNLAHGKLHVNS
jgi:hypothetical protein